MSTFTIRTCSALAVRRPGAAAARDGLPLLLCWVDASCQQLCGCCQAGGRADGPISWRSIRSRPKQRCGPICWHRGTDLEPRRRHDSKARLRCKLYSAIRGSLSSVAWRADPAAAGGHMAEGRVELHTHARHNVKLIQCFARCMRPLNILATLEFASPHPGPRHSGGITGRAVMSLFLNVVSCIVGPRSSNAKLRRPSASRTACTPPCNHRRQSATVSGLAPRSVP